MLQWRRWTSGTRRRRQARRRRQRRWRTLTSRGFSRTGSGATVVPGSGRPRQTRPTRREYENEPVIRVRSTHRYDRSVVLEAAGRRRSASDTPGVPLKAATRRCVTVASVFPSRQRGRKHLLRSRATGRVRFELTRPARVRRFSRPVHSTALPPAQLVPAADRRGRGKNFALPAARRYSEWAITAEGSARGPVARCHLSAGCWAAAQGADRRCCRAVSPSRPAA